MPQVWLVLDYLPQYDGGDSDPGHSLKGTLLRVQVLHRNLGHLRGSNAYYTARHPDPAPFDIGSIPLLELMANSCHLRPAFLGSLTPS